MEDIKKYIQSKLNNIEAELKRAKSNKFHSTEKSIIGYAVFDRDI